MVRNVVENHVITLVTFGEILFGVINYMMRPKRSYHLQISRAAHAGHIGAEQFGDLDRERTDASRSAVNQNLLSRLDFSFVAHSLQCRDTRDVDRGRLLKGDVCRLERDGSICARANIFSKGPVSATEYLITRFELGDVFANCFNGSGKINAESNVLGLAQPDPHCAHDLGRAFDEVPVEWVD